MIRLSREKIKLLHQLMAQATGGSVGVRDEGLLDSAIEGAFATFDGEDLYPLKEEKAAKLCYSLISNHAFIDGNKRIGVYALISFLELNGIRIEASDEDVIELGLGVADSSMSQEDVLEWIRKHRTGR